MKRTCLGACLIALLIMAAALEVAACGGSGSSTATSSTAPTIVGNAATTLPNEDEVVFTVDELAQFDGQAGQPAYVAVDGVVYDVTNSARWPEGRHLLCNLEAVAGMDLSQQIEQAPANMRSLLERMPVVGRLEE